MKHYIYKLIPPRPSFNLDMTDEEKKVMGLHIGYFRNLFEEKKVIAYGPVLDPSGVYGMAILEVTSEIEATEIAKNDPSVVEKINQFELIPMLMGLSRS